MFNITAFDLVEILGIDEVSAVELIRGIIPWEPEELIAISEHYGLSAEEVTELLKNVHMPQKVS